MTLLLYFFSPAGRFKRLTFWEGLVAWALINVDLLMLEVTFVTYPLEDHLARGLGDSEHVVYHFITTSMLFIHWVFAIWILAAISAKRWHDLNCPGWLAVINSMPVVFLGLSVLSYLGSVDMDAIHRLVIEPKADVFGIYTDAMHDYVVNFQNTHLLASIFWLTILYGSFIYLGAFKGSAGANDYGKQAA